MDGTLALQGMGDAQRNGPVVRPAMAVQGMATCHVGRCRHTAVLLPRIVSPASEKEPWGNGQGSFRSKASQGLHARERFAVQ